LSFKLFVIKDQFSSEEISKRAIDYLKAAMKDEVVETVKEPETPKPPSKKPKLEFVQVLANKVNGSDLINNLDQSIQFEYSNILNVDMLTNIFEWWHQRKSVYPRLHSLMLKYLIIPATSAASERVFSSAGLIYEDRRSRLSDEHVNMLIFLYKNLKNK
jgi:hypothetical protein